MAAFAAGRSSVDRGSRISSGGQRHLYALALGSNRSLTSALTPGRLVSEAMSRIGTLGEIQAIAPLIATSPMGPSLRLYVNSALLVAASLPPEDMLAQLKRIERQLGRRRHRRWGERRMDIDIILWSGGRWSSRTLQIPHRSFRERDFVLRPLNTIAPRWRDPVSRLTVRQLLSRLQKRQTRCVQKVDQPHPRL